ncbi:hypothetical protein LBMAG53_37360 [Planctomycetota bacterium]|nr:hypothetical protein LBMAG53_37360 [Planctomycetota bacterium]
MPCSSAAPRHPARLGRGSRQPWLTILSYKAGSAVGCANLSWWRCLARSQLILAGFLALCLGGEPAQLPATIRLDITLEKAVWPGGDPAQAGGLRLRLVRNHGGWERVVSADARGVNKTDQHGRALEAVIDDRQATVSVTLQEEPAPWDPPRDWNRYRVQLERQVDGGFRGTWTGLYHGREGTGAASAVLTPLAETSSAQPGEHPRLLFRKADLPALKAKAATPWGQAEIARLRKLLAGKGGPDTEGPTARAVALGLLFHLTGDASLAEEGRSILLKDIPNWYNVMYVHGAAACVAQAALAYDLLYDTADQNWRETMQSTLMVKMQYLYYPPVGGFNDYDGSNWSAMYRSAMGMASLAMLGEPDPATGIPEAPAIPELPGIVDLPKTGVVPTPLSAGATIGTWLHAGPFDVDRDTRLLDPRSRPVAGDALEYTTRSKTKATRTYAPLPATCLISVEQAKKYRKPELAGGVDFAAASGRNYLTTHLLATVLEVAETGHFRLDHSTIKLDRIAVFLDGRSLANGQVVKLAAGRHLLMAEVAIGVCGGHEIIESHLRFLGMTPEAAATWLATSQREHAHRVAVAAIDREDQASTQARRWLAVAEIRLGNWGEVAFGETGWNTEGEAYTQHAMRMGLVFEHAFRNAMGRGVQPGGRLVSTFPLYVAKTVFSGQGAETPSYAPGGGPLGVDNWARGFGLIEPKHRDICLAAWDRTQALADAGRLTSPMQPVAELDCTSAVFRFVNHPGTPTPATAVETVLPRAWFDRYKGGFVWRNAWKDQEDSVATLLTMRTPAQGWSGPEWGDLRWVALGSVWADRGIPAGNGIDLRRPNQDGSSPDRRQYGSIVVVPGVKITEDGRWFDPAKYPPVNPTPINGREAGLATLVAASLSADGSGLAELDVSNMYLGETKSEVPAADGKPATSRRTLVDLGIRARRVVAMDHSGTSGAPALMAVADLLTGTKGDEVWQFCTAAGHTIATDATGFTITAADGAVLRGTVVLPKQPVLTVHQVRFTHEINYHARHSQTPLDRQVIRLTGTGSQFVVVMTVSRGALPPVQVDGAKATVGGQTVAWDGRGLILGNLKATPCWP